MTRSLKAAAGKLPTRGTRTASEASAWRARGRIDSKPDVIRTGPAATSANFWRNCVPCCRAGCRTTGNRRSGARFRNWTSGSGESCVPFCGGRGNVAGPVQRRSFVEARPVNGPGSPRRMAEVPGGMPAPATCTRRSRLVTFTSLVWSASFRNHNSWQVETEPPCTESYPRWRGRTGGAIPPPTRCG